MPFHSCSCLAISRNAFSFSTLYADKWHAAINSTMGWCDHLALYLVSWLANFPDQWALLTPLRAIPGCTTLQRETWQVLLQTKCLRNVLPAPLSSYRNLHSTKSITRVQINTSSGGSQVSQPPEHLTLCCTHQHTTHTHSYITRVPCAFPRHNHSHVPTQLLEPKACSPFLYCTYKVLE